MESSKDQKHAALSEPAVAYDVAYLQVLKSRLMSSIEGTNNESILEQCLSLFCQEEMPCVFSDVEFAEEIRLAEEGGVATEEELEAAFAKWRS